MKVYVAVGHGIRSDGRYDPGAVSADGNWSEQSAGDIVVKSAADTLRSWGVDVKDEAYQDDPNYSGTDDLVRAWGADLLVTVHHDWIKAETGFFALWWKQNGRELGETIEAAVARAGFPLRDYPADGYRGDLSILKTVGSIPVTLVECGRIGQYTTAELRRIGIAIARGIADYAHIETQGGFLVTLSDSEQKEMLVKIRKLELMAAIDSFDEKVTDAMLDLLLATATGQAINVAVMRLEAARAARDEYRKQRGV
ncbi:MAG: N-acetylmuramoyl-L-alanine amidase [Thioalkalivibrio sp.]|nr:N-acetylmuramoyl-L-alanine amidase [Thioalkalivibrio sp.]